MDGVNTRVSRDGEAGAELSLRVKEHAGRTVVAVTGEVDLASSPQLRACLRDLEGIVIIDLAGVTFLDSSGLSTIVGASKRLRDRSGALRLRAPRPSVRQVIEITGLGAFLI